jgi:hypothetical protein
VWAASATFGVGDVWLGVRSSTDQFDARLRRALAAHLAPDVEAPANYSCKLATGERTRGQRSLHFLYRGTSAIVRTRSERRLMHALLAELSWYAAPPDPSLLSVHGVGLAGANGAVVAPPALRPWLSTNERRLQSKGLRIIDTPTVLVDPARAEVVVPEPALTLDRAAIAAYGRPGDDEIVAPGRFPIRGWAFFTEPTEHDTVPRARAVAMAAQLATNVDAFGLQESLEGFADVMRGLEPRALTARRPGDVVAPLVAMA